MVTGDPLWWQSGIIYQIYPRSFKDANGDGIGDLVGVIEKLDYLEWLGVQAAWLSPIYPSPMADFGYDVADYIDIDPVFGDLAAFDRLVAEAHARNLKVILDFVPNHTSDEHEWFQLSRASRTNPYRDWYIWRDPQPNGGPPNNWLAHFGGSAWQFDEATGQYYLHLFHTKQPDLNWRNPEVRRAMYDVMRFWFERGVDGFRIDVITLLIKDEQLRDNPTNPDWKPDDAWYKQHLSVYSGDQDEVHEIVQEMRQVADEYHERVLIGETYLPYQRLVRYYGEDLKGAHLPFNFELVQLKDWQAAEVKSLVDTYEAILPVGAWPNWVLGNHDRSRLASRIGPAQARIAQMLLLTLRGTPTCYYGDELGMADVPIPADQVHDPAAVAPPFKGRDPERTPMQWDSSPNAGFCPADVQPWLPVADDYRLNNVETERDQPTSMLSFVHKLIKLRQTKPALNIGDYHAVDNLPLSCFAYIRALNDQSYLITLNFSGQEQTLSLPQFRSGQVLVSTHMDHEEKLELVNFSLRANEGLVIEL